MKSIKIPKPKSKKGKVTKASVKQMDNMVKGKLPQISGASGLMGVKASDFGED